MIRIKRNSTGTVSLAKTAARLVVAAGLALSFFAWVVPLRSSASSQAMAGCVGKAGHCNSGLIAKRRPKPEPELLCGLKGTAESVAGAKGDPADEIERDDITIVASPEENQSDTEPSVSKETSQPEAQIAGLGASMTKPCPTDCCASTTGIVRPPRPREASAVANSGQLLSPQQARRNANSFNTTFDSSFPLVRTSPRGPPILLRLG